MTSGDAALKGPNGENEDPGIWICAELLGCCVTATQSSAISCWGLCTTHESGEVEIYPTPLPSTPQDWKAPATSTRPAQRTAMIRGIVDRIG